MVSSCFSGWAKLRGFYTARTARLDTSRAANHLLRLALEGKICLCLRPPGYSKKKGTSAYTDTYNYSGSFSVAQACIKAAA
jgi:hypothetical protein